MTDFKVGDEVRLRRQGSRFRGYARVVREPGSLGLVMVRWPYWGLASHPEKDLERR